MPMVMGTALELIVCGKEPKDVTSLWDWLCTEAESLQKILNRFDPSSEVSRVNASASVEGIRISRKLSGIISDSMDYWKRTGCLFDIAKGKMQDVRLESEGVLTLHGATLDFGGFAKGYLLKGLKEMMELQEIGSAFVDFGSSSILAVGHHPFGDCWKVGVKNPFGDNILKEADLCDTAMSTSGNIPGYEGHIVHPLTGVAAKGKKVATVICPDPLDAEVLSTALIIASEEDKQLLKRNFPNMQYYVFDIQPNTKTIAQ